MELLYTAIAPPGSTVTPRDDSTIDRGWLAGTHHQSRPAVKPSKHEPVRLHGSLFSFDFVVAHVI
jgi:hypothetical protein